MRFQVRRSRSNGVTLIELLVALSLVGIVLAAASTMLLQSYANEAAYREQNQSQQNARAATDILSDDLRGALKNSVTVGTPAWNNPIRFTVMNDQLPTALEPNKDKTRVVYWLDGTNLRRELFIGGASLPSQSSATSQTSGSVVARDIYVSTGQTHLLTNPSTNVMNVDVTSTVGTPTTSTVRIRAKVTMRNYLF